MTPYYRIPTELETDEIEFCGLSTTIFYNAIRRSRSKNFSQQWTVPIKYRKHLLPMARSLSQGRNLTT